MMKTHFTPFFSGFVCIMLLVACEKQTTPEAASNITSEKISKDTSALVIVKAAGLEEHEEHGEHEAHHDEKTPEHRELGAHVHGAASMNLVLENSLLNITMSIPGMDAVGFEHPAVSADEQAILQKALAHLQNPDALFLLSKNADCHLLNGMVETALLNKEAKPGVHADVDISYQWQCKNPDDLKQVSVQLFAHLSHLQKIQANWISQSNQSAVELTKDNAVLELNEVSITN